MVGLPTRQVSNRQSLHLAIVRAGRGDEFAEAAQKLGRSTQATYRTIRDDDSRTDAWKAERLDEVHKAARVEFDELLDRMAGSGVRAEREEFARVFGIAGLPGDAAMNTISFRDATERAERTSSGAELRELLNRALMSGDETLVRAVAAVAFDRKDTTTLHAYTEARPDVDAAVERIWNGQRSAETSLSRDSMTISWLLLGLQP